MKMGEVRQGDAGTSFHLSNTFLLSFIGSLMGLAFVAGTLYFFIFSTDEKATDALKQSRVNELAIVELKGSLTNIENLIREESKKIQDDIDNNLKWSVDINKSLNEVQKDVSALKATSSGNSNFNWNKNE